MSIKKLLIGIFAVTSMASIPSYAVVLPSAQSLSTKDMETITGALSFNFSFSDSELPVIDFFFFHFPNEESWSINFGFSIGENLPDLIEAISGLW